jgi:hypothetical protein
MFDTIAGYAANSVNGEVLNINSDIFGMRIEKNFAADLV